MSLWQAEECSVFRAEQIFRSQERAGEGGKSSLWTVDFFSFSSCWRNSLSHLAERAGSTMGGFQRSICTPFSQAESERMVWGIQGRQTALQ